MQLPIATRQLSELPGLTLTRSFLRTVFMPEAALGTAWGDDELTLIAEETENMYRVALYARASGFASYALSVVTYPPVRAQAVLRFGSTVFRAPFDWSGTATVAPVPAELLAGHEGSSLVVTIEPNDP